MPAISGPAPIRPLDPADTAQRQAAVDLLSELHDGDRQRAAATLAADLASGQTEYWVFQRCGEVVLGLVALTFYTQSPNAEVEWLAVAPAARRQGIASQLLRWAQERCRQAGVRHLFAYTYHTNRASLHCYLANGFLPHHTLWDYLGPGRHYVCLIWPVTPPHTS